MAENPARDAKAPGAPDAAAQPNGGATPEFAPEAVDQALEADDQIRKDVERFKDLALRAHADLENYRKRVARDLDEERKYGGMGLLRDLLPVLDNMYRAIEAAEKTADATSLLQGFKMVTRQLEETLGKHHCRKIDALHQPFDPARHQAILQQPSGDHPAGTVLLVAQEGYQLHDRVVRPSQVIVSSRPADDAAAGDGTPQGNR